MFQWLFANKEHKRLLELADNIKKYVEEDQAAERLIKKLRELPKDDPPMVEKIVVKEIIAERSPWSCFDSEEADRQRREDLYKEDNYYLTRNLH